ncbi:hypothetical protein JCM6882_008594 [Rhodosporidiobolus microsporus]
MGLYSNRVLDDYYLGISAIISIGAQASVLTSALYSRSTAIAIFGTAHTCIGALLLTWLLGLAPDGYAFEDRGIAINVIVLVYLIHLAWFNFGRWIELRKRGLLPNCHLPLSEQPFPLPWTLWIPFLFLPWLALLPLIIMNSPRVGMLGLGRDHYEVGKAADIVGLVLIGLGALVELVLTYTKLAREYRQPSLKEPLALQPSHPGSTTDGESSLGHTSAGAMPRATGPLAFTQTYHPLLFSLPLLLLGLYFFCASPGIYILANNDPSDFDRNYENGRGTEREGLYPMPGAKAVVASVVGPVVVMVGIWVGEGVLRKARAVGRA